MFSESSSAKSPRIVPGAESSGFVAPIIARTTEIADSPESAEREIALWFSDDELV